MAQTVTFSGYVGQQSGKRPDRTGRKLQRAERYAGRSAKVRAMERETDEELRRAVRGTWIALEIGDTDATDETN